MAEPVSRFNCSGIATGSLTLLLLLLLLAMPTAFAENLKDPTRPSSALGQVQGGATGSVQLLQSILIAPDRKVAVIGGQTLGVGDKFGEARIVRISEGEVVLQNGKDLQTLKLFPGIEKKASSSHAVTKPDNRGQHKVR